MGTIHRERVTQMLGMKLTRSDPMGAKVKRPLQFVYTDPEGAEHYFDTKRAALEYAKTVWEDSDVNRAVL